MATSTDGGATWSAQKIAGPFKLTWLPSTSQGHMVGDYSNTTWSGTQAATVFALASAGACQLGVAGSCHEAMGATTVVPITRSAARASAVGAIPFTPASATVLMSMR